MKDTLTTIASFETAVEAHALLAMLEAEGIRAVVSDGAAADTFWYMSPATGGAKVQVAELDATRAREILASIHDAAGSSDAPWRCAKCNEEVEANFKVCWSCGGLREDVEAPPGSADSPQKDAATFHFRDRESSPEIPSLSAAQAANPYASSQARLHVAENSTAELSEEESPELQEVEAIVRRAFAAAVIGLVSCPLILHLYSLFILIPVLTTGQPLNPTIRPRMFVALAIDLLIVLGAIIIFLFLALQAVSV